MSAEEIVFNSLLSICLEDPDRGLELLDNMTREAPGTKNGFRSHTLYFVAYCSKAMRAELGNADNQRSETIALLERSLQEYRVALDIATDRQSTESRFNFQPFEKGLDAAAISLEKVRPGRVQEILGFTKMKYMSDRVSGVTHVISFLDSEVWRGISEVILRAELIIKTIFLFKTTFDDNSRSIVVIALDQIVDADNDLAVPQLIASGAPFQSLTLRQNRLTGIWQLES